MSDIRSYVQHIEVAQRDSEPKQIFIQYGLAGEGSPRPTDCHDDHIYYFSEPHDQAETVAMVQSLIFNQTVHMHPDPAAWRAAVDRILREVREGLEVSIESMS